ncbi:MAG: DUF5112 domain-containing protein [Bacteroidaceae bacterium]|nr:DUF5112 domain-containing protein [Bacteroidaceae bacterium]
MAFSCHERVSVQQREEVDSLNRLAYRWHYKNVDSVRSWAAEAYAKALRYQYHDGAAEALNNLAFERFQQMDFDSALSVAGRVAAESKNLAERLVADVTMMKVAQRTSDNRSFFLHRADASHCISKLSAIEQKMTPSELLRFNFGRSDFHIVSSTYFYYLDQSERALAEIRAAEPYCQLATDTAQWLYYCYMRGSGGLAENTEEEAIASEEFNYLLKCFWLSRYEGYSFFDGNSEQSLATLLADSLRRTVALEAHPEVVPLLSSIFPSGNLPMLLAKDALNKFIAYDDLYQEACALRTLGELSFDAGQYNEAIGYYSAALDCVNFHHQCYYAADELLEPSRSSHLLVPFDPSPRAQSVEREWVSSPEIKTVPEWISGIRQQLSVAYSALNLKPESDYNRNIFLDLLDVTREDAELESRAVELASERQHLHRLIAAMALTALLITVFLFTLLRRWHSKRKTQQRLLRQKLQQIKDTAQREQKLLADEQEELLERQQATELRFITDKQQNIEKRAKLQLVQAIVPFLDRIIYEVRRMRLRGEVRKESLTYISELTTHINELNDLLTEWIQMQQGQLSLQISSFELSPLFESLRRSHYAYDQKGLNLNVEETTLSVKADRALTLFMLNTLADNARKFTPEGGTVCINATAGENEEGRYVELSVSDTGCGMSTEDIALVLNNKVYDAAKIGTSLENYAASSPLEANILQREEPDSPARISQHNLLNLSTNTAQSHDTNKRVMMHELTAAPEGAKGFGFGLMNCKGIIEKYRKTNALFRVCLFGIESEVGQGSRFWFRLPRVAMAGVIALVLSFYTIEDAIAGIRLESSLPPNERTFPPTNDTSRDAFPEKAYALADSVYYCNLDGRHSEALQFAEAALKIIGTGRDSLDYSLVLGLRNEQAVAALAVHDWVLYRRSNEIYTRLYKLVNRDESLEAYCQQLERSQLTTRLALWIIVALFVLAALAAYFLYFLPQLRFSHAVARLNQQRLQQLQLQKNAERERRQADVEMAEDEHRRRLYEESRLHVQNQIIDNCLSTIKHETMYYPSRINQLVERMFNSEAPEADLATLSETAGYYKDVYSLLMAQALQQSAAVNFRRHHIQFESVAEPAVGRLQKRSQRLGVALEALIDNKLGDRQIRGDADLLLMLLNALLDAETDFIVADEGRVGELRPLLLTASADGTFARLSLTNPNKQLTPDELHTLFTPHAQGIQFLIAKQIIREHDTFMGHPGCRINAEAANAGHTIWFTVPLAKT